VSSGTQNPSKSFPQHHPEAGDCNCVSSTIMGSGDGSLICINRYADGRCEKVVYLMLPNGHIGEYARTIEDDGYKQRHDRQSRYRYYLGKTPPNDLASDLEDLCMNGDKEVAQHSGNTRSDKQQEEWEPRCGKVTTVISQGDKVRLRDEYYGKRLTKADDGDKGDGIMTETVMPGWKVKEISHERWAEDKSGDEI
jgi:hypothetical protein